MPRPETPASAEEWQAFYARHDINRDEQRVLETKSMGMRGAAARNYLGWTPAKYRNAADRLRDRLARIRTDRATASEGPADAGTVNSRRPCGWLRLDCGLRTFVLHPLRPDFEKVMADERLEVSEYKTFPFKRVRRPKVEGKMDHSTFRLELKNLNDAGVFEGDLAVYGNVDYGQDLIEPGAFTKTLRENNGVLPLFLNHAQADIRQKVGALYLTDTPKSLRARGVLNLSLQAGQEARSIMQFDLAHNLKTSMSIGYRTVVDQMKNGVRHLKELKLFEGSLVGIGMNSEATVSTVKSNQSDQEYFAYMLADFQRKLDAIFRRP